MMKVPTLFVIQDNATKLYLPHRKVQTRAEFGDNGPPRLCTSAQGAQQVINCWKMGYWRHYVDTYGDSEGPMPSDAKFNAPITARRQAMDLSVVPVMLMPV